MKQRIFQFKKAYLMPDWLITMLLSLAVFLIVVIWIIATDVKISNLWTVMTNRIT